MQSRLRGRFELGGGIPAAPRRYAKSTKRVYGAALQRCRAASAGSIHNRHDDLLLERRTAAESEGRVRVVGLPVLIPPCASHERAVTYVGHDPNLALAARLLASEPNLLGAFRLGQ
jgi:hypothetical protein